MTLSILPSANCCRGKGLFLLIAGVAILGVGLLGVGARYALIGEEIESPAEKKGEPGKGAKPKNPFPDRNTKAPPLDGGIEWLNSGGPIELSKLKGKVVLLDFWTYCCINCMHILPDLAKLEKEFPNELVVIGVHSAKFDGERDSKNIRDAIMRYNIKHPVVNDARMQIWSNYGVRAWPTRILIDPQGNLLGYLSGEGQYELVHSVIKRVADYHKSIGTLDETPLHFQLEKFGTEATPLRYPGKVAVDPDRDRLFIADSTHNRIVVASLKSGKVTDMVGDGVAEMKDGPFAQARFNDPQGMAFDGDVLYVADTKNHSIRKLDLAKKTVTTIAGTGMQGYERSQFGPAKTISLASPWDLCKIGNGLFIAMAGTHQIWKLDLAKGEIGPFAGTGRESIVDGPRDESAFSQPSGLTTDGKWLYVADSEVSAVRRLSLTEDKVGTLVGTGLFDFGDADGDARSALLQHALGVAYHNGKIYIADTYNNKLKTFDLATNHVSTFLGDHKAGTTDDPPRFDEPAGIAFAAGKLYVADTNNHRVVAVDLATKKMKTVALEGLTPPAPQEDESSDAAATTIDAPAVVLKNAAAFTVRGNIEVPEGFKLNPQAPMSYRIEKVLTDGAVKRIASAKIKPIAPAFEIDAKGLDLADAKELRVSVTYFPCSTGSEGVCKIKTVTWKMPVTVDAAGVVGTVELKP